MATYNLLVKLLDGKTLALKLNMNATNGGWIQHQIRKFTGIPDDFQLLVSGGRCLHTYGVIYASENNRVFPTVSLLLRLRGGKGGFGSLLRGAATKAGQKKTNNFDACRDMSGRRIRHVNAEKKLEEWRDSAEERRLEKIANDFIKKKAKSVNKIGDGEAEEYLQKYREESAKCVEAVEASVRQVFDISTNSSSKRKTSSAFYLDSKRFKIWMGKRKLDDSDGDVEDEEESDADEENGENLKSPTDHEIETNSSKESQEEDSSCISNGKDDSQSSCKDSCEGNLEDEMNTLLCCDVEQKTEAGPTGLCESFDVHFSTKETTIQQEWDNSDESKALKKSSWCSEMDQSFVAIGSETCDNKDSCKSAVVVDGELIQNQESRVWEKQLDFLQFDSPRDMEVLGMDRLKLELQTRGLKCGGTLRERATRLFLLKTTPLELLPKKLFSAAAKK